MIATDVGRFVLAVALVAVTFDVLSTLSDHQVLPSYKVAIGILSARENFAQRKAIRSSWLLALNHSSLKNEIFYAFILANKDCDIPVKFRTTKYDCEEIRLPQTGNFSQLQYMIDTKSKSHTLPYIYPLQYTAVALDFTVLIDIVINGIFSPNVNSVIELWDLASDELVLRSDPVREDKERHGVYRSYRYTNQYLLPKGFVGSIICFCPVQNQCLGLWNPISQHFAIKVSPIISHSTILHQYPQSTTPTPLEKLNPVAFFTFNFPDPVKFVSQYVDVRSNEYGKQKLDNLELSERLLDEKDEFDDIIFLSDTDGATDLYEVYANLPRKVVSYHQWVQSHITAQYVMKVDDDSYLVADELLNVIDNYENNGVRSDGLVWLGSFRRDWLVDRFGKWAEHKYHASSYPTFACGSGYVMSSPVSTFLTENAQRLRFYQGEDVSMGIWLSCIDVEMVEAKNWNCDDACDPSMIVSAQHSPESLVRLWKNRLECGNPCSCELHE